MRNAHINQHNDWAMAPPNANRSTRGSAMAPPLCLHGSFNDDTPWQNQPTAPPLGCLMKRDFNGASKQPSCNTS